jgi:hypothetical protein
MRIFGDLCRYQCPRSVGARGPISAATGELIRISCLTGHPTNLREFTESRRASHGIPWIWGSPRSAQRPERIRNITLENDLRYTNPTCPILVRPLLPKRGDDG